MSEKIKIEESNMIFGEYDSENVFYIEKSNQYQENLCGSGIKISEFILLKDDTLYIIEAKTSCPNHNARNENDKKEKYEDYVNSISSKFKNTLSLYINILLKRYTQDDLSSVLKELDYSNVKICFLLVVKNAELSWLLPYKEVLQKKLNEEIKIWKANNLLVINEDYARKKKFVL